MNFEMLDGMRVKVRLYGEESETWHIGTVIKERKQWVEIDATDPLAPFIADESCISHWESMTHAP